MVPSLQSYVPLHTCNEGILSSSLIALHIVTSRVAVCILFNFQMLAKFAEDDRIEQMNAQKRRMKQLEHKRAVEELIEDRRAQFAADRERELAERREEERMEAFRKQIIEEERQKLLQEHAMRLLGYLPKVRT